MFAAEETLAAQGSTAETGVIFKNMLESAANTLCGSNIT